MADACQAFAALAQSVGHVGLLNCDSVVTATGEIYFTEINGRAGGCTHIDVAARRLLGEDYARNHVLLTQNSLPIESLSTALGKLSQAGLAYDKTSQEGVILLEHHANRGTCEYMVVGDDGQSASRIEEQAWKTLGWRTS